MSSWKEEAGIWAVVGHPSGRDRLLTMKLGRQGKAVRHEISGVGGSQEEGKAGLTFLIAAKAGPKVALTSTRSRIQAGSFPRIGGRAYR